MTAAQIAQIHPLKFHFPRNSEADNDGKEKFVTHTDRLCVECATSSMTVHSAVGRRCIT